MRNNIIQKIFLYIIVFIFSKFTALAIDIKSDFKIDIKKDVYDSLHLDSLGLTKKAYQDAISGYNYLIQIGKIKNDNIISIVDFNLPSFKKRLFIIDIKNYKLLFNTYVSHGRNSGKIYAVNFSNSPQSYKSSLGFYITSDTYNGHHGYSLRLEGIEQDINTNLYKRNIVIHSSNYVSNAFIKENGYSGRSEGCLAIPTNIYVDIINTIKLGSCIFVYKDDKYYYTHSSIINHNL